MQIYLSEIFKVPPSKYGFRGDPHFWKYLEGYFSKVAFPYSEKELIDDIYRLFYEVSGVQLTVDARVYVEQFAHGGMSSGQLSGEFWVNSGIPMIVGRYREMREGR